jgi:hypothetical protein
MGGGHAGASHSRLGYRLQQPGKCVYTCVYIYIYIVRERDRRAIVCVEVCVCVCV